jgi:hypothetical protein
LIAVNGARRLAMYGSFVMITWKGGSMNKLYLVVLAAVAAAIAAQALAQAPAPAPAASAPAAGTVKAVQPGLFEVAGPRVNDVMAAGIQKITATPGKGGRSIHVQSPWGDSFYGWPKNVKPVAFTIEVGKPAGGATISAPGFTEATRADYRTAIESVIPFAIASTKQSRNWRETGSPAGQ